MASAKMIKAQAIIEQARDFLADEYEKAYEESDIRKVQFLDNVVRECRVYGYVEGLAKNGFSA